MHTELVRDKEKQSREISKPEYNNVVLFLFSRTLGLAYPAH